MAKGTWLHPRPWFQNVGNASQGPSGGSRQFIDDGRTVVKRMGRPASPADTDRRASDWRRVVSRRDVNSVPPPDTFVPVYLTPRSPLTTTVPVPTVIRVAQSDCRRGRKPVTPAASNRAPVLAGVCVPGGVSGMCPPRSGCPEACRGGRCHSSAPSQGRATLVAGTGWFPPLTVRDRAAVKAGLHDPGRPMLSFLLGLFPEWLFRHG